MNEITHKASLFLLGTLVCFVVQWIPLYFYARWLFKRRLKTGPADMAKYRRLLIATTIIFPIFAFVGQSGLLLQVISFVETGAQFKPYRFELSQLIPSLWFVMMSSAVLTAMKKAEEKPNQPSEATR